MMKKNSFFFLGDGLVGGRGGKFGENFTQKRSDFLALFIRFPGDPLMTLALLATFDSGICLDVRSGTDLCHLVEYSTNCKFRYIKEPAKSHLWSSSSDFTFECSVL